MSLNLTRRSSKDAPLTAEDYDSSLDAIEGAVLALQTGLATEEERRQDALAGKAEREHGHVASEISDSTEAGRTLLTAASLAARLAALGIVVSATEPANPAEGTIWLDVSA